MKHIFPQTHCWWKHFYMSYEWLLLKKILQKIYFIYCMLEVTRLYEIRNIISHTFELPPTIYATNGKPNIYTANVPPIKINEISKSVYRNVWVEVGVGRCRFTRTLPKNNCRILPYDMNSPDTITFEKACLLHHSQPVIVYIHAKVVTFWPSVQKWWELWMWVPSHW